MYIRTIKEHYSSGDTHDSTSLVVIYVRIIWLKGGGETKDRELRFVVSHPVDGQGHNYTVGTVLDRRREQEIDPNGLLPTSLWKHRKKGCTYHYTS